MECADRLCFCSDIKTEPVVPATALRPGDSIFIKQDQAEPNIRLKFTYNASVNLLSSIGIHKVKLTDLIW